MAKCVTCSAEYADERKSLGYDYCTSADCGRKNYRGKVVAEIAINKAAPELRVLDEETVEAARRGEFGKRHNRVLANVRSGSIAGSDRVPGVLRPVVKAAPVNTKRPWTPEQEQFVRANIALGFRPADIVAKDRTRKLTQWLVTQIAISLPK